MGCGLDCGLSCRLLCGLHCRLPRWSGGPVCGLQGRPRRGLGGRLRGRARHDVEIYDHLAVAARGRHRVRHVGAHRRAAVPGAAAARGAAAPRATAVPATAASAASHVTTRVDSYVAPITKDALKTNEGIGARSSSCGLIPTCGELSGTGRHAPDNATSVTSIGIWSQCVNRTPAAASDDQSRVQRGAEANVRGAAARAAKWTEVRAATLHVKRKRTHETNVSCQCQGTWRHDGAHIVTGFPTWSHAAGAAYVNTISGPWCERERRRHRAAFPAVGSAVVPPAGPSQRHIHRGNRRRHRESLRRARVPKHELRIRDDGVAVAADAGYVEARGRAHRRVAKARAAAAAAVATAGAAEVPAATAAATASPCRLAVAPI